MYRFAGNKFRLAPGFARFGASRAERASRSVRHIAPSNHISPRRERCFRLAPGYARSVSIFHNPFSER
jgi:hypothetical protein